MNRKQTNINVIVNIMAFIVQFAISFFITPILIEKVGAEAYGFIGLSNDFTTYIAIITTIFNSVSARFISLSIYEGDLEKANKYFNSVFAANVAISTFFTLIGVIFIPNLQHFINIPLGLETDVKLTFAIILASYIITVLASIFTTAVFVKNRLDIQGIRNIIQYVTRLIVILIVFALLPVKIYWIAFASLVATIVVSIINVNLTKKLTPEIKINILNFDLKRIKELVYSGGWMAFTSVSNILIRGLDLLITNLFISSYYMGLLSVSRTFPNNITGIIGTIAPIFTPVFISVFAEKNTEKLVKTVRDSIMSISNFMFTPITVFIVFSSEFYSLWLSSRTAEEIKVITILSIITCIQAYFNSSTATTAQLSLVTNRLKIPVMVSFGVGVANVFLVLILLKVTNLGIYAIVLSSTMLMCARYILFNSFYGAYVLGVKTRNILLPTIRQWLNIPVLFLSVLLIKHLINVNSWITLILACFVSVIVGYIVMFTLNGQLKTVFAKFCKIKKGVGFNNVEKNKR